MVQASDYAPYHNMAAFWQGVEDYEEGFTAGGDKHWGVMAQAYDRGMEYAMRLRREQCGMARTSYSDY